MDNEIKIGTEFQINGRKAKVIGFTGQKRYDLLCRDEARGVEFIASSKQVGLR